MGHLKIRSNNEKFMVRNIFCIGKNYLDHIKELDTPAKTAEVPKTPVVFLKPTSAIMTDRVMVTIPVFNGKPISNDLQNEVELVVIIGKGGYDIQSDAKAKGLPWEISKGFRFSSPVSEIVKKEEVGDPEKLGIRLKVNGVTKQDGNTSEMIFRISYIIHYLSSIFGLSEGDIIFTGTPAGVTKLYPGDIIEAEIDTIGKLNIKIG
jgi:2-keto-4-pentenoate hydratase/2-oxohepta-3-ene-1,7-dioic acid hydratase in catechol pathway